MSIASTVFVSVVYTNIDLVGSKFFSGLGIVLSKRMERSYDS